MQNKQNKQNKTSSHRVLKGFNKKNSEEPNHVGPHLMLQPLKAFATQDDLPVLPNRRVLRWNAAFKTWWDLRFWPNLKPQNPWYIYRLAKIRPNKCMTTLIKTVKNNKHLPEELSGKTRLGYNLLQGLSCSGFNIIERFGCIYPQRGIKHKIKQKKME